MALGGHTGLGLGFAWFRLRPGLGGGRKWAVLRGVTRPGRLRSSVVVL